MAAASAWQAMAGQLESIARGYTAVISGLQGESWSGNASTAMGDAAGPYVAWMATAAAKAEETASQARAAAAAYEAAFAATVPPALVMANRAQYAALVMANIFGQYTAQIAAAEAAYADMWAQDAQAMYSYASASSAATALTPFTTPPETTTATGQLAQNAAVAQAAGGSGATNAQSGLSQLMAAVPQQLQNLATAAPAAAPADPVADPVLTAFSSFNTLSGPTNLSAALSRTVTSAGSFFTALQRTAIQSEDLPKIAEEGLGAEGAVGAATQGWAPGAAASPVLAGIGQAEPIGGLSVPQSWASATPVASAVADPQWLSEADLGAVPASSDTAMAGTSGAPMVGMTQQPGVWSRPTVSNILRVQAARFKMPRPFLGG
ncbi:PPE domain-containing protein [Candidatus Mycobacterium wuenschmannii]|uniref:PPE domain-containing protein n=2 Tax=Candidatus Mycobacterium wuenschmannii TaxID=3027808 RepID=A0ABY8W318_9MYCO|nr:PPE domain-containing protein [Candidatus Mycobacterium wuenschmannii]WIM89481.1 PPE domain-containing protein [Candidatus Mycobacterium wuenschmannii]